MNKISIVEEAQLKKGIPGFNVGDTVKVYIKIPEEEKVRIQVFEGVIMRRRGTGIKENFTVRRVSYGEGVEKIFPLHSPSLERIEVVKTGKVRRAKLYYLRGKVGKGSRIESERKWEEGTVTPEEKTAESSAPVSTPA